MTVQPFRLRHSFLVQELQRRAVRFDLVHALTRPRHPLAVAVLSPFPWRGTGVATYICKQKQGNSWQHGFAQALKRPGRPESDVLILAPTLNVAENNLIWQELLTRVAFDGVAHGVQRVFASVPLDGPELESFRQAGFVPYTQETIFYRPPRTANAISASAQIRPQTEADAWSVQRLYNAVTPPLVQQAEGGLESESSGFPPAWWELGLESRAYVLTEQNELKAVGQMQSGPAGHWLRLWSAGYDVAAVKSLLTFSLSRLDSTWPRRPVFCAIRDYQGGLQTVLQEAGFQLHLQRMRLVKHLAVRVKEAEPVRIGIPNLARTTLTLSKMPTRSPNFPKAQFYGAKTDESLSNY